MYSEIVGVNYQHTKHADARGGGQAKLEENKGGANAPSRFPLKETLRWVKYLQNLSSPLLVMLS